ncbi:SDR family oxidoreductase [uncultured Draconibacterium sp.]|uniref:SDR family oxidoreductase n=1 Tax=uncultured Draconibacterium sp. TaxID=1573823 RepID=UPI0029C994DD|nr:SDR family oxidoreductase [uncultured Draconibacterium sp.]
MSEQKTAVVTGAGKGIGEAIATGLAQLGYQTVLVGRNKQNLEQVAKKIGNNAKVLQLDITDKPAVKEAVAKIVSENGSIDILVNNAGIHFSGSVDIAEDEFERMLETNLTAQYSILKEVVPVMKAQKSGYIFNVASRAGKVGFSGGGAYSASKFGMVGLSESLYRELNPLGIKVTALCPGWVNTEMAVDAGTPLESDQMIQPNDLFKTIEWLLQLSPGACVKEVILESPNSIS